MASGVGRPHTPGRPDATAPGSTFVDARVASIVMSTVEDPPAPPTLEEQVAALTEKVATLETEAHEERERFLRVGHGGSSKHLAGKHENEIIADLENQHKDTYYELQQCKSKRREMKLRIEELEKESASVAALTEKVATLETEAHEERERFLRVGHGGSSKHLAGKHENEIIADLENQHKDTYYELQKCKSMRREMKLRIEELEKELKHERKLASDRLDREVAEAKSKAEAEASEDVKEEADAEKAEADAKAKAEAEAEAKAKAEEEAKAKAEADAKADAEAKAKAEADASASKAKPLTGRAAVRAAMESVDSVAKHDAARALALAAEELSAKYRADYPNVEFLLRRALTKVKEDADERRHAKTTAAYGPSREASLGGGGSATVVGSVYDYAGRTRDLSGTLSPDGVSPTSPLPRSPGKIVAGKKTPASAMPPPSPAKRGGAPASPSARAPPSRESNASDASGAGGIFAKSADLGQPDVKMRKWIMEKQQKEAERARMKRAAVQREVKWMEEMTKRQLDRNKAARKAEEAAEAKAAKEAKLAKEAALAAATKEEREE